MKLDWKVALPLIVLIVAVAGSIGVKQENEIMLYGRRSSSGTYIYFRNNILEDEYSPDLFSLVGNESIIESVRNDKNGIGYVGVGYVTTENDQPVEGIKILNIAKTENSEPASPLNPTNVKTGRYPIARPLYQYVATIPREDNLTHKYLKFELSNIGEQITIETGFYPPIPQDKEQNENQFEKARERDPSEETASGNKLLIKGSDTILQLAANLVSTYTENNPDEEIVVEGGGSGTGIAALIGNRVNIANSSRKMDPEEIDQARKNGIDPLEFIIARDCISIIVNDDNPIDSLTVKEVSRIFSGKTTTWADLR